MAANLTNEITSTDGLPFYIEEARSIGIAVDPPDVNRSDVIFDVVEGRIVFGLKGIKGMGENAAQAIVKEREENGLYSSFMDFITRTGALVDKDEDGREKTIINKKAIEVLIKTGAFDNLTEKDGTKLNRATLLANMESAMDYVSSILDDKRNGQGDLFEDFSEEEKGFVDFKYKIIDDIPYMEILNMEKECIGCYVSGHPLDIYKKAINKAVTVRANNIERIAQEEKAEKDAMISSGAKPWQLKDSGKSYIALGMINGIREITTKKGDRMAFAKLNDYDGQIDLTFFPKNWETLKMQIQDGEVYAFKGKVDGSRDTPSLIVDSIENPDDLENHSATSVHIKLSSAFTSEQDIFELKDFLFERMGKCGIFFHLGTNKSPYVVKVNNQITIDAGEETISQLKKIAFVEEVWTE